jgi:hypothetical protein
MRYFVLLCIYPQKSIVHVKQDKNFVRDNMTYVYLNEQIENV